jgi:prolyl-tRNA synthetase
MLNVPAEKLIKTLLYKCEDGFIAALVRGDRQLNELKLAKIVGGEPRMCEPEEINELTGAQVGFSGPVGLAGKAKIIADEEIAAMCDAVAGANQTDAHLLHVTPGVHFTPDQYADLREAAPGDACAFCESGTLQSVRGIELAHVFKLGTKYSEAIGALFQDEKGELHPMIMGCYGIGVSRCVAAVVEQWHDDSGIIWPLEVAPFQVAVLLLDPKNEDVVKYAEGIYADLQAAGFEVLLDERDERPGFKFKDTELIGYPLSVVVGKKAAQEGMVEVRRRKDKVEQVVPIADAVATVKGLAEGA